MENGISGATLDLALIGHTLTVQQVQAPHAAPEWARWLEEIGFIVGEQVMLMARGLPGGDPMVFRVGQSTFALRRAEAACVRVAPAAQAGIGERKP
ncbi:MAG: ferrous iron transport protein A [Burkholderiales bacterium]|nr:ferrous iron transport protein A [Burkholderiales bacterium]